ncbi:hypothetical protein CspeluHIS016_0302760 [Cutaneotrichosporon spelunceum]|uniref:Uncharacterized protein n=1 Tax=Cutaneotrichosporon spelunceum TaxID=1672016 RepID=A0AAD3YAX5_9TREE|nr:hypothetical protein CspeluHIS016_0302760 [Cutaneotrichosporon spelunceum]
MTMTRPARLFKRDDNLAYPALFGKRRSQTEGGERERPWARFTARPTATETPEPACPPAVLPSTHPFLQDLRGMPDVHQRHASRAPLRPPRASSSNPSLHSISDLSSLSLSPVSPVSHRSLSLSTPSKTSSSSPGHAPSFRPAPPKKHTPLPTPPPSASHAVFDMISRERGSWSGHPFAVRPTKRERDHGQAHAHAHGYGQAHAHEAYDYLAALLGGTDEPQGMVAEIVRGLLSPPPSPPSPPSPPRSSRSPSPSRSGSPSPSPSLSGFPSPGPSPGSSHPFSGRTRPRRGTFGTSDGPPFLDGAFEGVGSGVSDDEYEYGGEGGYEGEYGKYSAWR